MQEAGLPAGVLNVIPTSTAGATTGPLIKDSRLRKLSFTGSTEVGRRLLADASETVLRTSMELGGNAPFVVFEDADLDKAVEGALAAKMRNMGEACTAANRFIVQDTISEAFAEKFAARIAELTPARGTEEHSKVGPLIDGKARDGVHELVTDAISHGATAVTGGAFVDGPGYFYQPTVLTNVSPKSRILAEEIFGPVAPIVTFRDEDEAVALANGSEYGLVAYVYTKDLNRGLRVSEKMETGMLGLNAGVISNAAAPFGGVKQSGLGREGGLEGIEEYLYTQYIGIADPYAG
jgi:succinate-semialdehyde dehydrogenase/glutarate-semialdehyde dehydrogenase